VASRLIRSVASMLLPLWGVTILALGVIDRSGWWIATGVGIGIVGALLLAGAFVRLRP
jgi:hypothetical protein